MTSIDEVFNKFEKEVRDLEIIIEETTLEDYYDEQDKQEKEESWRPV